MGLTVDADIDESALTDLGTITPSDLQSDIIVGSNGISGILNYIDDYSSAGYLGDEKSGHFLVLHAEVPETDDVTITAELIGGAHGEVTLDSDGLLVTRITSTSQRIRFTASKEGEEPVTRIFRLNGLLLE